MSDSNSSCVGPSMKGRIVVVMGPPGAGKGTLCKELAAKYGFLHLCTGDIFRNAVARKTDLGLVANRYIQDGKFVPDELVVHLIQQQLQQPESVNRGVLLDGFPRTPRQATALAATFSIERVVLLQVPQETCLRRVLSRRVDPETGDIYNLTSLPTSLGADVRDRLVRREYDIDERIVAARLRTYYSQLGQVLTSFPGKIQALNGHAAPAAVLQACISILDAPAPAPAPPSTGDNTPQLPTPAPSAAISAQPAAAATTMQCTICFDAPAQYAVVPCGHQCGCRDCLSQLQASRSTSKCPICRKGISSILRVYRAGLDDSEDSASTLPPVPPSNGTHRSALANTLLSELMAPVGEDTDASVAAGGSSSEGGGWGPAWGDEAADAGTQGWGDEAEDAVDAWHGGMTVSIEPVRDIVADSSNEKVDVAVMLDIADKGNFVRAPVDVCCVIDVSGSMGKEAECQDDDGAMHGDGLSMLDIAKHAAKVVIEMLSEQDRLTIVSFSNEVSTVFTLGEMSSGGKAQALTCLEKLCDGGSTDLWGGLLRGMDLLRTSGESEGFGSEGGKKSRKQSLILLTDGQPSITPPRGFAAELKGYLETHPNLKFQLNTFGFGYSLNSQILTELAAEGHGTFAFVPDARILGTCFINAVANAVCCCSQNNVLHLLPKGGAVFGSTPMPGNLPVQETSWGRVVALGPVVAGSYRDVIVPMDLSKHTGGEEPYLEAIVVAKDPNTGEESRVIVSGAVRKASERSVALSARAAAVTTLDDVLKHAGENRGSMANKLLSELSQSITETVRKAQALTTSGASSSAGQTQDSAAMSALLGLQQDVDGRITKALTTMPRFSRWGKHYLRAILRAHQLQQCTNYMDPGLQCYGKGVLFKQLVAKGGNAFVEMPPPVSTLGRSSYTNHAAAVNGGGVTQQMGTTYYAGSGGGCFHPQCTVSVVQDEPIGSATKVVTMTELRVGDRVLAGDGIVAVVQHVVAITGSFEVLHMGATHGGLVVTPTHPVRIQGQWTRPHLVQASGPSEMSSTPVVYNVVLQRDKEDTTGPPSVLVNGVECITWGHNLPESSGVAHPFYGTDAIIRFVQQRGKAAPRGPTGVMHVTQEELRIAKEGQQWQSSASSAVVQ